MCKQATLSEEGDSGKSERDDEEYRREGSEGRTVRKGEVGEFRLLRSTRRDEMEEERTYAPPVVVDEVPPTPEEAPAEAAAEAEAALEATAEAGRAEETKRSARWTRSNTKMKKKPNSLAVAGDPVPPRVAAGAPVVTPGVIGLAVSPMARA